MPNCDTCKHLGNPDRPGCVSCYSYINGEFRNWEPKPSPVVAIKEDGDKNRLDLLPIGPMEAIAEILTFGAKKYDDHNWRNGFKWSRLYGALLRHLFAWIKGQDKDPETCKSHLAHAGCCILFLLEHEQRKLGEDDRYKTA